MFRERNWSGSAAWLLTWQLRHRDDFKSHTQRRTKEKYQKLWWCTKKIQSFHKTKLSLKKIICHYSRCLGNFSRIDNINMFSTIFSNLSRKKQSNLHKLACFCCCSLKLGFSYFDTDCLARHWHGCLMKTRIFVHITSLWPVTRRISIGGVVGKPRANLLNLLVWYWGTHSTISRLEPTAKSYHLHSTARRCRIILLPLCCPGFFLHTPAANLIHFEWQKIQHNT